MANSILAVRFEVADGLYSLQLTRSSAHAQSLKKLLEIDAYTSMSLFVKEMRCLCSSHNALLHRPLSSLSQDLAMSFQKVIISIRNIRQRDLPNHGSHTTGPKQKENRDAPKL